MQQEGDASPCPDGTGWIGEKSYMEFEVTLFCLSAEQVFAFWQD